MFTARFRKISLRQVSRYLCGAGGASGRRRVRRAGQRAIEQAFASHASDLR